MARASPGHRDREGILGGGSSYSEASMKRLTWAGGLLTVMAIMAVPSVASAQIDQLIGFNAGGFFPRTESNRDRGDVLLANLDTFSLDPAGPGDDVGRGLE